MPPAPDPIPLDPTGPGCSAGFYGTTCDTKCLPSDVGTLKTPTGEAATNVSGANWVTPSLPSNSVANCVWGCPPGTGYTPVTKSCVACTGSQVSDVCCRWEDSALPPAQGAATCLGSCHMSLLAPAVHATPALISPHPSTPTPANLVLIPVFRWRHVLQRRQPVHRVACLYDVPLGHAGGSRAGALRDGGCITRHYGEPLRRL